LAIDAGDTQEALRQLDLPVTGLVRVFSNGVGTRDSYPADLPWGQWQPSQVRCDIAEHCVTRITEWLLRPIVEACVKAGQVDAINAVLTDIPGMHYR